MGAYRDDKGKPYTLKCIREAEKRIFENNMDHEYAGIQGIDSYIDKSMQLAYGPDSSHYKNGHIAAVQSISGTGSIRVGMEFLKNFYPIKDAEVYTPDPTWPIHRTIQERVGYKCNQYRYYDRQKKNLDFGGMHEDLANAKDGSIVFVHVCAHNPTGQDPSKSQWKDLLNLTKKKNHMIFFDSAYQGFASGDLEEDSYGFRLFADNYNNIMLSQSFAKNFGLYGERVGALSIVTESKEEKNLATARMKQMARNLYSNPPIHGARLVDIVLSDPELTKMWHQDLKDMSSRMQEMRFALVQKMKDLKNPHNWSHMSDQIGMFAYTGLNKDMVNTLREDSHIYMTMDGRISVAGLNSGNIDYVAEAFHNVTKDAQF